MIYFYYISLGFWGFGVLGFCGFGRSPLGSQVVWSDSFITDLVSDFDIIKVMSSA